VPPIIREWEWDEGNLSELAEHGLDIDTVFDVWLEAPGYRKNTGGRPGYRMTGPDRGGAIWTIPIWPLRGKSGQWRAVTGWPATDADIKWYKKYGPKGGTDEDKPGEEEAEHSAGIP